MSQIAEMQSVEAAVKIRNSALHCDRTRDIVMNKAVPRTETEKEAAGYRDLLATINESYGFIAPTPAMLLKMNRELCKYLGRLTSGNYNISDIPTYDAATDTVRKSDVAPADIPGLVEDLCDEYEKAVKDEFCDELLLIPVFVFDLKCIRPFAEGNGRISRLVTRLLLNRAGFTIAKYISFEKFVTETYDEFREAVSKSAPGWSENCNDYMPFVLYVLKTLCRAYEISDEEIEKLSGQTYNKTDRVEKIIRETDGLITKTEIMEKCPDISRVTIQRTLSDLMKENKITKIGGGRGTKYIWKIAE